LTDIFQGIPFQIYITAKTANEYTSIRNLWTKDDVWYFLVYSIHNRKTFLALQRLFKYHSLQYEKGREPFEPPKVFSNSPRYSRRQRPLILIGINNYKGWRVEVERHEGAALADSLGCNFMEAHIACDIERIVFAEVQKSQITKTSFSPQVGINQSQVPLNKRWVCDRCGKHFPILSKLKYFLSSLC
jgi:hypothetical protein